MKNKLASEIECQLSTANVKYEGRNFNIHLIDQSLLVSVFVSEEKDPRWKKGFWRIIGKSNTYQEAADLIQEYVKNQ